MFEIANSRCCCCGGTQSALLFETRYEDYPEVFRLRRCEGCGLLFNSPRLIAEELNKLYEKDYYFFKRLTKREFLRSLSIYQRTLRTLKFFPRGGDVVEVGSAKGYLLAILKQLDWNVQGIELSNLASDYSRRVLGIPTFTGTVESFANSTGRTFDYVLAIDVIEHVSDPVSFVQSLARLCRPGGMIIVDTPNGAAANIAVRGALWRGFNKYHIYVYSIANLAALLGAQGFKIVKAFSYNNSLAPSLAERCPAALRTMIIRQVKNAAWHTLRGCQLAFNNAPRRHLRTISKKAVQIPSYLDQDDSKAELAGGCRGDNIVVMVTLMEAS